jgi:hypothetical protein
VDSIANNQGSTRSNIEKFTERVDGDPEEFRGFHDSLSRF